MISLRRSNDSIFQEICAPCMLSKVEMRKRCAFKLRTLRDEYALTKKIGNWRFPKRPGGPSRSLIRLGAMIRQSLYFRLRFATFSAKMRAPRMFYMGDEAEGPPTDSVMLSETRHFGATR